MKVQLSNENLEKIKRITIKTRRIMMGIIQGSSRSARKGMGLDFESLRDYMVGDDIRFIDWKASARSQSLLVKEFHQEQTLYCMVVVDVSASMDFGSHDTKKIEIALELAAAIVLMASYSGDAVGLVLYSDTMHVSIPAGKGALHTQYLLEALMGFSMPVQGKTKIKSTVDFLLRQKLHNALLFVISDGLEDDFYTTMGLLASRYHLYVMFCHDERERRLPTGAWLMMRDNESGMVRYLQLKDQLNQSLTQYDHHQVGQLAHIGAKTIDAVSVDKGIDALVRIFNSTVL
jgi:uncharacterized protein (DUF58 family)